MRRRCWLISPSCPPCGTPESRALRALRQNPATALAWRSGWRWAGVEGATELIGPDDPADGVTAEDLRLLLRAVFTAAGGTHDDWDGYDRAMREERRTVVLVTPRRVHVS